MTTTLVWAATTDGYVTSNAGTYSGALAGPGDTVTATGNTSYYGQNNNGGAYTVHQSFLRFAYTQPAATELVTHAAIRLSQNVQLSTSVPRNLEVKGYTWSGGGLTTADWRNTTQLTDATLYGRVNNIQSALNKHAYAGSMNLVELIPLQNYAEFVVISSRQRAGNTPTSDEGSAYWSADTDGTANDPLLVFSTVARHALIPVLGAQAQLSDGTWIMLVSDGAGTPTIQRRHVDATGAVTTADTFSLGTGSTQWFNARGAQGFTLCVDASDNIYVAGRIGSAENSLAVRAWVKGSGYTWTAGTIRTVALPTYDTGINNVSATWHNVANGTLVVVIGHHAGIGVTGGTGNELAYAILDATYLRTGTGTLVRSTGSLLGSILAPRTTGADYNSFGNEVGTGLDVMTDHSQADAGYVLSYAKGRYPGLNNVQEVGRYILNGTGTGFSHTSYEDSVVWAQKEAAGKLRIISVGSGQVAAVTADADSGFGLTVVVLQSLGATAGMVELGSVRLAGESIASMPNGPAVAPSQAWDAVYVAAENRLWIYYVDVADSGRLMRTAVDLDSYQATRSEVQVQDFGAATVRAVRVARDAWATETTMVTVALDTAGVQSLSHVIDSFNLAPTAATLTPRANFDATAAATFAWTFNDPNAGDTQSAYQLQVEDQADGSLDFDSTKTASSTSSRNLTGGTLVNGKSYRWRVRTWDALDTEGPWSDYGTFSTSAGGTVTITDPAVDNLGGVITDEYLVKWSVTGTTQASYRVILARNDTGATVADTGWVVSTGTELLVTGMVTDVEHTVSVQARNASNVVSGIGSRLITPSYGTPETPVISVEAFADQGYVLISVDNPIPGAPEVNATEHGFETDVTGWTATGGTVAQSATQAHRGTGSMLLTLTGNPAQAYARSLDPVVGFEPVTAGLRYACRFWAYRPVAGPVTASIDWYDVGGGYLSTSATQVELAAGTWTALMAAGTAPAGATDASFGPTIPAGQANGTEVYVDELTLALASDRPDVTLNQVLRRKLGSGDQWTVLGTTGPDGSFRDYTVPSWVPVEYAVRGIA